ncbi:6,7,8-trihydroxycoumarin synthase-like [Andrographis paniculata]|uniref:6,7,8-trihydroxycoumarin synthase-like n=1 Tax=Andrographis paniculata TaxID=175694 RepID=UPI0021E7AF45|nr:6,7,8-trihydroxycoumarin synthase-like [Andrographis paniculata]
MNLLLLLLITLSTIFISILFRFKKSRKPGPPPGPPPLPVIGNLHQLTKATHLHLHLWRLSKKYGPLLRMKLGSTPMIVVSSAKLAEQVLKTEESSICSRPKHVGQQKLSYNGMDMAFSPYNDHWRELRKITTVHLLSAKKIESFRPFREDEMSRMVARVSAAASSGQAVNLNATSTTLFGTLICRIAFGKRYEEGGFDIRRFEHLLHEGQAVMTAFFVSDYFPMLGWFDYLWGSISRLERIWKELDEFYQELIDEHLDSNWKKMKHEVDDILGILIDLKQRKTSSMDISWDSIKGFLMNIFFAGSDTSAAAVVWTMLALMKSPNVMKKLQAEIRESINGQQELIAEDDLLKLPYLKAVVSESLRLYPPDPLLVPRQTTDKCIIDSYEIEPKTVVYINAWAIARDPDYWKNPDEFLPERFLNNGADVRGRDYGVIPFGSGRRICPGMSMGLVNVEHMIANLVYSFDWEFPPGVRAENVDEDILPGLTMNKKEPLVLVPKKFYV